MAETSNINRMTKTTKKLQCRTEGCTEHTVVDSNTVATTCWRCVAVSMGGSFEPPVEPIKTEE